MNLTGNMDYYSGSYELQPDLDSAGKWTAEQEWLDM